LGDLRLGVVESVSQRLLDMSTAEERKLGLQPGRGTRFLSQQDERKELERFVEATYPEISDQEDFFTPDETAYTAGVELGRAIDLGSRKAPRLGTGMRLPPRQGRRRR